MKEATIIIVSYKSSHIIGDALKNIVGKGYRIIIVDNGSNDNIKEFLQENYPNSGIELILLENNCGFGKANNLALEMVETDFALLLNPDAIIKEESIEKLVNCAKKDPKIALAGALDIKSEDPSEKEIQESIEAHKNAFGEHDDKNNHIEVGFLCGGFMLLKMEAFKKIGFFDEGIFLYFEDHELCKRSKKEGYKNILVKDSFCKHAQSTSTSAGSIFEKYYILYKRHWHMGWSKMYLKRNKRPISFIFSFFIKTLSIILCLIKLDLSQATSRLGRIMGAASNMLGIDCFNKKNKVPKIKETVTI